jgi:UDP-galactopyranose mutase
MHIALLLRGHIRQSFRRNSMAELIRKLAALYTIDIYIHTWNVAEAKSSWRQLSGDFSPVSATGVISSLHEFKDMIKDIKVEADENIIMYGPTEGKLNSVSPHPKIAWKRMWHGMHAVTDMAVKAKIKYDFVINTRFDLCDVRMFGGSFTPEKVISYIARGPLDRKIYFCFDNCTTCVDNILFGDLHKINRLCSNFHFKLDDTLARHPLQYNQERYVWYEAARINNMPDVLIVGSGLSGATIANLLARDNPQVKIKVIDKRDHIGGNVYDYIDDETGIRVSKYGAHLFHTNDDDVWEYMSQFTEFVRWDHRVVSMVSDRLYVPVPVNINTVNAIDNCNISTPEEMDEWLRHNTVPNDVPKNSEEVSLARVGQLMYEKLFKHYTVKQWGRHPTTLDPSVMSRIPISRGFDDRYFHDKYQALPRDGYTAMIKKMLTADNIEVCLSTPWTDSMSDDVDVIIFTGPIDVYFQGLPKLQYRSIEFKRQVIDCKGYMQPNSVVNYPSPDVPYTRTVEYKHFLHQKSEKTVLYHERTTDEGEPYYPIPDKANMELYERYRELAAHATGVHFIGRLANYKYFNMDQAVRNAIDYYRENLYGIYREKS